MSALALIVAATLAQAGTLRSDLALRGGGAGRSVVALSAWDKGGSESWGAGIPTPTIDCAAVGTSSSASLQCSGASPSFAGPGQVAAGSPWWYRGDTAVRPAIALNGSTDYWGLGDVADQTGSFAVSAEFLASTVAAGDQVIVSKDLGGGRQFLLYRSTAALTAVVCKAGGTCTTHSVGTLSAGAWYAAAYSYTYVADGTSIIRSNLNGVAPAETTNAVGPPANVATPLVIGAYGDGSLKWTGSIRRVAIWTGWAADAAQLAQLVATQWGLAADKPSGTVATHARTDSTPCGPFSDSELYWLGPGAPCIHAPSYQGWASGGAVAGGAEVYGPGANALPQSDLGAWTLGSGGGATDPVRTANAAAGPDGTLTADKFEFPAVSAGWSLAYLTFTATAAPWTETLWARTDSGQATFYLSATPNGSTYVSAACDAGPTWSRCKATGTLTAATWYAQVGVDMRDAAQTAKPAQTVYLWQGQATPTAYPVPLRSTAGSAYAGLASTATTLTGVSSLLNKDRFALGISATATGNWSTVNTGLLQWGGSYGSANTVSVYTDASAKIAVEVYDGSAGWRRWTADAALSGTGQKRIGVAFNSGAIRVLVDDVEVSGTMSGAGTGLLGALPSTSLVVGTSGSSILRGLDARVCQANDVPGLKRCLR